MANEEHLKILKNGSEVWNKWRQQNPLVRPDLTDLSRVDLNRAHLRGVDLSGAYLRGACLREAYLRGAYLRGADLSGADLSEANLRGVYLREAYLRGVNLLGANLRGANLRGAYLSHADFTESLMLGTLLVDVDLSEVKGLETIQHVGPSSVGIDTIYKSKGKIPEIFLRGAGVPEPFIVQMKALVSAMDPIQFYSCFISYSSKDEEFAERLYADLQQENVRCWFDREDLKIGDEIRPRIDEAIRKYDKLLIVLSKTSVESPWVRKEVETAFGKEIRLETEWRKKTESEREPRQMVLFPIRLDDAVMETNEAWAADLRRMRHIGDFRGWKEHDKYKKAFERLLGDLKSGGE